MTSALSDVTSAPRIPGLRAAGTGLEARGIHAWFGKHHALEDIFAHSTACMSSFHLRQWLAKFS
jgi:hypothetical protein